MPKLIAERENEMFIPRLRSKYPANMADKKTCKEHVSRLRGLYLANTIRANRKRRLIMKMTVHYLLERRRRLLYV